MKRSNSYFFVHFRINILTLCALLLSTNVFALNNYSPLQDYTNTKESQGSYKSLEEFYQHERFTLFESGQVRPIALSKNQKKLFVLNTPNNSVEIFHIKKDGNLKKIQEVRVGLEPVALAVRKNNEIWVVNHLSDSVSIIKRTDKTYHVVKTLWVGDEPRDIVFAGKNANKAFITTAHRGQNTPFNQDITTPNIGRADVWVFDAKHALQQTTLQTEPLNVISLFTDTPRALTVSQDGQHVYAAGFHTGNQTTIIPEEIVLELLSVGVDIRLPFHTDASGEQQPVTGIIVKYNGEHWVDELGRNIDAMIKEAIPEKQGSLIKFSLPDRDVFKIDAFANPPQLVEDEQNAFSGVGTILFNMITNPKTSAVYVTNTDAQNQHRFEGPGIFTGQTVRGHLHESRITVIKADGSVHPRHLNKHINYDECCDSPDNSTNNKSFSMPLDMAIDNEGKTLYFTAYGSNKVGVIDTEALEDNSFTIDDNSAIRLPSSGGPSGIVLHEKLNKMYVLTRFDNTLHEIDLSSKAVTQSTTLFTPEPAHIVEGRPFLYDAAYTSSNGENSCGSCHVFGDFDSLAWDLGNPDDSTHENPGPIITDELGSPLTNDSPHFRAMKGPMTTQSLRGLANHGPMHWRGDRTGGRLEASLQPDQGSFNEAEAFRQFNPAFEGLIGRHEPLSDEEMESFTRFALEIFYPPNPIRALDNQLSAAQQEAKDRYFGGISDFIANCDTCHTLDPLANEEFDVTIPGFFGTNGSYAADGFTQVFKIPHLRNMYQKVGMFGMHENFIINPESETGNADMGEQVRGFGFRHDGSVDTLFRFFQIIFFSHQAEADEDGNVNPDGFPLNALGNEQRRNMESFMLAFDTNLKPIVGQQITVNAENIHEGIERILLMMFQSHESACDLVVNSKDQDYLYLGNGLFHTEYNQNTISSAKLYKKILYTPDTHYTFMCAPPGSGLRLSIDQNLDNILDGHQ